MSSTDETRDHLQFWELLARKKTHATQIEILDALRSGAELSPAQFAKERKGLEVGKAGYHFRVLAADGLVRMTRERPVRGAVEHFYVATPAALADVQVGESEALALERIDDALFEAVAAGVTPEQIANRASLVGRREAVPA